MSDISRISSLAELLDGIVNIGSVCLLCAEHCDADSAESVLYHIGVVRRGILPGVHDTVSSAEAVREILAVGIRRNREAARPIRSCM